MNEKATPLSDIQPGCRGVIVRIEGNDKYAQRLMSLSLLPGRTVRLVRCASLGDPMMIDIGECALSLRRREAARIFVTIPAPSLASAAAREGS